MRNAIVQQPLQTAIAAWMMLTPLAMGGGSAAILAAMTSVASPAHANEVLQWSFDPAQRQLSVTVPGGAEPSYFLLAEPPRIVVDVPGDVGNRVEEQAYSGAVRHIRVGQFQPGVTRIVMELSPDVVFAPGQVELSATDGDRWVVRPLLADAAPVAAAPVPDSVDMEMTAADIEFAAPSEPAIADPSSAEPSDAASDEMELPPLEPGAVELDVPTPTAMDESEPEVGAAVGIEDTTPDRSAMSDAIAPSVSAEPPETLSTDLFAPFPDLSAAPPEDATAADASDVDAVAVTDEPVDLRDATATDTTEAAIAPADTNETEVSDRQSEPDLFPAPAASEPPSATIAAPVSLSNAATDRASVDHGSVAMLEFGQPLPTNSSIVLPVGTRLTLRYPGARSLSLSLGSPRQEVLLLHQPVVDRGGRVVVPANTQVLGRFETSTVGSRFVVQALSVNGQNIQVEGQSGWLGDRSVSDADLIRNAAIGAAAGTVLTTLTGDASGVGLIGGAAAGAATTYMTAPEPAVIQPNQLIEVQLTEDLAVR